MLRIGQDYALKQGETVHDVVVVFSPASIDGYVRGDVTVVLGTVQIGPTAVIDGSLVVIGGNVTVQPGAAVHRDLVVIGGGLDAPTNFTPGGQHVAIGATALADRVRGVVPWITEGLLLGRPIVPRLSWVWVIVFFVFLASLALIAALHRYRAHVRGRDRGEAVHDVPGRPARPAAHRSGVGHPGRVGDRHRRRAVRPLRGRRRVDHR